MKNSYISINFPFIQKKKFKKLNLKLKKSQLFNQNDKLSLSHLQDEKKQKRIKKKNWIKTNTFILFNQ